MTKVKYKNQAEKKMIAMSVSQRWGFEPVTSKFSDNSIASIASIDGKSVHNCRCMTCGKLYRWNSLQWMLRHYQEENNGKLPPV